MSRKRLTPEEGEQVVAEKVVERIIQHIEAGGVLPWDKPWITTMPLRISSLNVACDNTAQPYHGLNELWLRMTQVQEGYESPYWGTYKEAQSRGWQVRKGEKGQLIASPSGYMPKKDDEGNLLTDSNGQIEWIFFRSKYHTVFNACQMDGALEALPAPTPLRFDPVDAADDIILGMPNPPKIEHTRNDSAYYAPRRDTLHMPVREMFKSVAGYYGTFFHELTHSTGHPTRLNRDGVANFDAFGSDQYAAEELIAQIGSALLMAHAGMEGEEIERDAAYLKHWMKKLTSDPKILLTSSKDAQKAVDYILKGEANE